MAIPRIRRNPLQLRRLKRQPIGVLFILMVALTLAMAALTFIFGPKILDFSGPTTDIAGRFGVFISVLSFAFTVGAGVFVLFQISESNEIRNLDLYRDIYRKMMSDEAIKTRGFIYREIPQFYNNPDIPDPEAAIQKCLDNEQVRTSLRQVMDMLDYFGFLVARGWMTADDVIDWLSPVVVKLWARIGPLVTYECKKRPEEPDYYQSIFALVERCEERRNKRYPDRKPVSFDRRNRP